MHPLRQNVWRDSESNRKARRDGQVWRRPSQEEKKGDGDEEKGRKEKVLYILLRAASDSQLFPGARAAFVYVQS